MNPLDLNPDDAVPDEDDHTVMVDREVPDEDDHTVMVDRQVPDEDDHTIVVSRAPQGADSPVLDKPQLDKPHIGEPGRAARRRGLTPPPVPAGFAPQAVETAGPHATQTYRPRAIPEPPPAPVILQGPDATREASATMPSVARHAQITARVALVVFVVSCVASIVGLTLIALSRF